MNFIKNLKWEQDQIGSALRADNDTGFQHDLYVRLRKYLQVFSVTIQNMKKKLKL